MKLVYVEWLDSTIDAGSWEDIDELNCKPGICQSVGWLVKDTKKVKVVVPHMVKEGSVGEKQGCGSMTIPAMNVIKIKRIKL